MIGRTLGHYRILEVIEDHSERKSTLIASQLAPAAGHAALMRTLPATFVSHQCSRARPVRVISALFPRCEHRQYTPVG
jgi:hypothetical protein